YCLVEHALSDKPTTCRVKPLPSLKPERGSSRLDVVLGVAAVLSALAAIVALLVAWSSKQVANASLALTRDVNQPAFVAYALPPLGTPLTPGRKPVKVRVRNVGPSPALDV